MCVVRVRQSHQEDAVTELTSNVADEDLSNLFGLPDEASWQERALCAQTDPEAFFPEMGASPRAGKKICVGCDVRGECLEYSLMHNEQFGIWGGLTVRERRRLARPVPVVPVVRTIPCPVPGCPNLFVTELGAQRHARRSTAHAKRAS